MCTGLPSAADVLPMRWKRFFPLLMPVAVCPGTWAQPVNDDCATAIVLCDDQPLQGQDNTGATGWPGFCPGTDNLLWYTFTTNSVGGAADITIADINCPVIAGADNELSVIVLAGDGTCTPGTFSAESLCVEDSVDFTTTTNALAPNTQYWVVVAGVADNGATITAQCEFEIGITGPGVDIVGVDFSAGPDVEIGEGETTQLGATGGTTYNWSPTDGLTGNTVADPFASPSETTTYTCTTVIDGCTYADQVIVEVIRLIEPPTTFTPNGDGINDTWRIHGIDDYPNAEVSIFDRWGQRVYKASGYKTPWDGEGLPVGTYYYVIDLKKVEGQSPPYTGYVAIVR